MVFCFSHPIFQKISISTTSAALNSFEITHTSSTHQYLQEFFILRIPTNANECPRMPHFSFTTLQLLKLFQQLQNVTHHFTRILQYLQYLHYLQFRIFPSTPLRTQHSRDFTHSSGSVTTSSRVL